MSWSRKYQQIRKDISYIKEEYGDIYNYCGGWCNNDRFQQLLDNPNYETAFTIHLNMLEWYFYSGTDNGLNYPKFLPVSEDKRLQKIAKRWEIAI